MSFRRYEGKASLHWAVSSHLLSPGNFYFLPGRKTTLNSCIIYNIIDTQLHWVPVSFASALSWYQLEQHGLVSRKGSRDTLLMRHAPYAEPSKTLVPMLLCQVWKYLSSSLFTWDLELLWRTDCPEVQYFACCLTFLRKGKHLSGELMNRSIARTNRISMESLWKRKEQLQFNNCVVLHSILQTKLCTFLDSEHVMSSPMTSLDHSCKI